ncbi:MAG: hypothetical protein PHE61_06500, partial [Candidatus Omnitrophica bacterium]|nr:hypothetical protein [Candidatus Omnitrophota bacterium]
ARKLANVALILMAVIFVATAITVGIKWAAGFTIGSAWSLVNFLVTLSLLKIGILEKSKSKLLLILLVKFPVLYLVGFLVLILRFFPASSLLTGLALPLAVAGGIKLWPKAG